MGDRFEVVAASAVVGAGKPDPAIFHHALDALGVAPGEALHCGDLPAYDCAGAAAAGVRAVLIDRAGGTAGGPCPTHRRAARTAPAGQARGGVVTMANGNCVLAPSVRCIVPSCGNPLRGVAWCVGGSSVDLLSHDVTPRRPRGLAARARDRPPGGAGRAGDRHGGRGVGGHRGDRRAADRDRAARDDGRRRRRRPTSPPATEEQAPPARRGAGAGRRAARPDHDGARPRPSSPSPSSPRRRSRRLSRPRASRAARADRRALRRRPP